jgi:hypothetical protein
LPDVGGEECARDSEQRGKNEACWFVAAGMQKLSNDARDEANDAISAIRI